jgi:hypothetical protein
VADTYMADDAGDVDQSGLQLVDLAASKQVWLTIEAVAGDRLQL